MIAVRRIKYFHRELPTTRSKTLTRERNPKSARNHLGTFATNAASQLNVLGHNGDTLGMDRAQVGVFKESHEVGLRSLLQGKDGGRLEAQVILEILRNLANQALERRLADQEIRGLLVLSDFAESDGTRTVAMGP